MKKPFVRFFDHLKNGIFYLPFALLTLAFLMYATPAQATDGATEALELRYQAELAIGEEQAAGSPKLAEAMRQALPELLQDYLVTRDGTVVLDTVDAAYVQEQFKIAKSMEEPGVALALDVFSGPGTGFEHGLRTSIANLADFHERKLGHVSDSALEAHERVIQDHLEKIESHQAKLESKLEALSNRLADKAEKTLQKAAEKAEKAEEKVEKATEKAEKAEEKVEKAAEKAEKVSNQTTPDQKTETPSPTEEKKDEKESKKK